MNFTNAIKRYENIPCNYIVVGVSSGPDSMALLHMLQKNLKKEIICAHINHNVRKESEEEEEYLKEYCIANKIIFETNKITSYSQNNFENEAREKRYAFYKKVLKKYNTNYLFLAHHGDDLIETVLMKISRGSNIEGYAGIKEESIVDNIHIIRPLLYFTKEELVKYNQINNIKYFIDKTNEDVNYKRNKYRKKILPILKEEDKNIHLKYLKYSKQLQEYDNYIKDVISSIIDKIYIYNCINIDSVKNIHPFLMKNIIYHILSKIYDNKTNIIKEKNIIDIIKLIHNPKPNVKINLPKNYIAKKEYNKIYIEQNKEQEKKYKYILNDKLIINDIIIKKVDKEEKDDNTICRLNSKDIKFPLYIRNRIDGDYIILKGLNKKKKVKDIFIEKKIPKEKRDKYPLLTDANNNILWIPNLKKSKYISKKDEIYDIILTSSKKEENK